MRDNTHDVVVVGAGMAGLTAARTLAEAGRQPWVIWGLLRTEDAASPAHSVSSGTALFTLLGFAGLYLLVGVLFLMLIARIVARGPEQLELTEA